MAAPGISVDGEDHMEKEVRNVATPVAGDNPAEVAEAKCPVAHGSHARRNRDWWPDALDISVLHRNSILSDPMGENFEYARAFESLDLNAVIQDLHTLM